jgi:predicted metal-dependent hydrolase
MKPQGTQLSLFEPRSSSDPCAVRVSPRARRLTARVHVGGRVEIVVPVGVNAHAVRDFVQRFTPWINRKVAAMRCFVAPIEPVPPSIQFGLTGEYLDVQWRQATACRIEQHSDRIIVHAPDDAAARVLLQGWLRVAAQERLVPQLLKLAAELKYSGITPRISGAWWKGSNPITGASTGNSWLVGVPYRPGSSRTNERNAATG